MSLLSVILIAGVVLAAWAVLRVIGGERQRQMRNLEAELAAARRSAEQAAAAARQSQLAEAQVASGRKAA